MNYKYIFDMEKHFKQNNIAKFLLEKQMTQAELSEITLPNNRGKRQHINAIINNRLTCIELGLAVAIAKALGKNVEEVFIF